LQLVIYFYLHRGKFAGKNGKLASSLAAKISHFHRKRIPAACVRPANQNALAVKCGTALAVCAQSDSGSGKKSM
jgi:hypothetical protein